MPSGKTQSFPRGTLLADALMDMGVRLKTPCGGKGTCGKCEVKIEGWITSSSGESTPIMTKGKCFSCLTYLQGNACVHVREENRQEDFYYPQISPDDFAGFAVDIGTTSVKIAGVTKSGETYILDNFLNPQRRFGDDIISRIAAADHQETHGHLSMLIRKGIASSIAYALKKMNLPPDMKTNIVFSGNTTMLYLLAGLKVTSLGRSPYTASIRDFDSQIFDLGLMPSAKITILPVHSAFLGADLIGGLAVCVNSGYKEKTFFIDLGTNGEIFLINPRGDIFASSCAMGPALEGMNISSGMTADDGAITHIRDANGSLVYEMLGQGNPAGLCGTALIERHC
jgi:uncharacterized 2Fe-2S/4Fe-4S cluster protein (DUF4445 family)